jgi:hypothetical protein
MNTRIEQKYSSYSWNVPLSSTKWIVAVAHEPHPTISWFLLSLSVFFLFFVEIVFLLLDSNLFNLAYRSAFGSVSSGSGHSSWCLVLRPEEMQASWAWMESYSHKTAPRLGWTSGWPDKDNRLWLKFSTEWANQKEQLLRRFKVLENEWPGRCLYEIRVSENGRPLPHSRSPESAHAAIKIARRRRFSQFLSLSLPECSKWLRANREADSVGLAGWTANVQSHS